MSTYRPHTSVLHLVLRGLAVGLVIGAVFLGGYALGIYRVRQANSETPGFELLWQIHDILNRKFVGELPPLQSQVYGAAKGLASSFNDQFTTFVEPAPRRLERDELRGQFGGIGAVLGRNDKNEMVLTVMPGRPAARAGIQDGDILLAVDGKPVTTEMTVQDVVLLIRGDIGTAVTLDLRRPGQAEPFSVTVIRERIETPSVEWRVLEPTEGIGYIRISIFGERTSQELRTAIAELAARNVSKLVLDLRGNGGGLVDAAVDITSQFLREGIVLRELRRGGQERFYTVKEVQSPAQGWQLAILVDGGTASASEIVSGALRDQREVVLIGEKTFGKGSVQEVHEFPDGSSLHVTVARWLTPDRHQIDKTGLQPDIVVNITAADRDAGRDPQLVRAEAWLRGER